MPVKFGELEVSGQDGNIGRFGFISASLEQQNIPIRLFGEAISHNGTCRSGADDDEVVIFVNDLLHEVNDRVLTRSNGLNGQSQVLTFVSLTRPSGSVLSNW